MAGGVEYQVTKVDPTDPETKGMVHQVHKVSEEIAATIGGKVYRARIINDPTAPTVAGKVYQIVLIDDPDDPSVKGMVYNAILTGGSEAVVVGPAVSPLSLPDAIADSLTYVKAFGGTEQNGTPTPDTPVDIVSNNGTIKFSPNEANYTANNVVLGYWLRNSDGQPESSPANFYTATMPVKPNVSYVCFGRNKETNTISGYNRIAWYDADGVWIRNSTYTQNQPGIDVAPSNAAFARFHCNINGTPVTQELVDSYNWVFQQGTAEVPYVPYVEGGLYTDGTVETIEDTIGNIATTEMLLKVGNYQDVQSILDGVVTRNVGIKVLDGTEAWAPTLYPQTNAYRISWTGATATLGTIRYSGLFCTHFEDGGSASTQAPNKMFFANDLNINFPMTTDFDTIGKCLQYLADQYAAGTPVIVIYPLATPTTESVTGQTLQVQDGDNTLEITQAGLTGLELEAGYEAAVTLSVQEAEDANLDDNVTVTIG